MLQFFFKEKKGLPSTNFKKSGAGFTIIELLAVLAIISLMVVVVVVSLGNSKDVARDAAIKTSLIEVARAAEILYNNIGAYDGVCNPSDTTLSSDGDFGRIKNYIEKQKGTVSCKDNDETYAVISSLNQADCWCVDSQGSSKEIELEGEETCSSKLVTTSCP